MSMAFTRMMRRMAARSYFQKEPDPTEIGARVRELRLQRGLTQEELARDSGIGQSALSSIEKGNTKRSEAVTILRLASTLRTTAYFLLWGHELPAGVDPTMAQLANLWLRLDDTDRAKLLAYAQGLLDAKAANTPKESTSPRVPHDGRHGHSTKNRH